MSHPTSHSARGRHRADRGGLTVAELLARLSTAPALTVVRPA